MAETEDYYDIGIIQLALHFYRHLSNRTGFFQAAVRLPEKTAVIFLFFADTMRCRCHNRVHAAPQPLL